MADRVVVFMDYQNVHGWARRCFLGHGADVSEGHVSPAKVGSLICDRRKRPSELEQVRVYRGRPNPERQPGAARANDRQTAAWERNPCVHVVRRNLDYPSDWPAQAAHEKGIDVAVAVDMIHLAMSGQMDVAVLFSSDKDLLPPIELLLRHRLCHVEVAAWQKGNRLRIDGTQLPWCHNLNEEAFESVRDTTDYAAPVEAFPSILRPKIH